MDKNQRKINIYYIFIIILLVILIGVMTFLTFYTNEKFIELKSVNKNLSEKLNNLNEVFENTKNENTDIVEEINKLNNLKTLTENEKQEVFKLASKLEKEILDGKSKYKIAYLTFDDGPYYLTDKFLDVLDKYGVKGTFFTIGAGKEVCFDNYYASCSGTYKKIVDRGHTIANHTYSHAIFYGLYSSKQTFINDVKTQENLIKNKTGVTTNIVRFPGGSATAGYLKQGIIEELRKMNYGWVDWTAQDGDGGDLKTTTQAWNYFTNSINEKIEVVLFHDYSNITLSILPQAIEYLQNNNYILLPLFYDSVMINK